VQSKHCPGTEAFFEKRIESHVRSNFSEERKFNSKSSYTDCFTLG